MAAMDAMLEIYFALLLLNQKANSRNFVGCIGATCRSEVAKIVPIETRKWPPS